MNDLALVEQGRLAECEAVIDKYLDKFYDVGNALTEIRDSKLYRAEYGTFEDYCVKKWNIKKSHAYRLINASNVIDNLSPVGDVLPASERQARELSVLPQEEQAQIWQAIQAGTGKEQPTALEISDFIIKAGKKKLKIFSGNNEWYTPGKYIESARLTMGRIDLDPASNDFAQKMVQAETYYTAESNGLDKTWGGCIWMNPPYSKGLISPFIDKVTSEAVDQAIVLTNSDTSTDWWHKLANWADAVCFPSHRLDFYDSDGKTGSGGPWAQSFFYKGSNVALFRKEFSQYGTIVQS